MNGYFMGQVEAWSAPFIPRGWAACDGQLLSTTKYSELFSLLGTTYGGDGQTTFALPDLRKRVVIGSGKGAGLSQRDIGDVGGSESVALALSQIPAHNHEIYCDPSGNSESPKNANPGMVPGFNVYSTSHDTQMAPLGETGNGTPHENMQPYMVMRYIICVKGWFPQPEPLIS